MQEPSSVMECDEELEELRKMLGKMLDDGSRILMWCRIDVVLEQRFAITGRAARAIA